MSQVFIKNSKMIVTKVSKEGFYIVNAQMPKCQMPKCQMPKCPNFIKTTLDMEAGAYPQSDQNVVKMAQFFQK
jgi:hypothetical protein